MPLRYEASQYNDTTVEVRDTRTKKRGFYNSENGTYKMGDLKLNLNDDKILDQLYWMIPIGGEA